jgi:hypothetical protein
MARKRKTMPGWYITGVRLRLRAVEQANIRQQIAGIFLYLSVS